MATFISLTEASAVIDGVQGEFFSVRFIKRTNGEVRDMTCRKGVRKYLAGGEAAYSFKAKGLVSVFDVDKMAYRSIPRENILRVVADGTEYIVRENMSLYM